MKQKIEPCPLCGEVPLCAYACGEHFIMSVSKPVGICFCGSFTEMHSSESRQIEAWNNAVKKYTQEKGALFK